MSIIPTVMILGTDHFDKSTNNDLLKTETLDVFSEKRQLEMLEVINSLKDFAPTKVLLEYPSKIQSKLSQEYQEYLNGTLKLSANERHQIGFRLAEEMNHSDIYAVDWNEELDEVPDVFDYGMEHEPETFQQVIKDAEKLVQEANEYSVGHTIKDQLLFFNELKRSNRDHQTYMKLALIGKEDNPVGAKWLSNYWYYRNMLIYKKIKMFAFEKEERIIIIYGAAHIHLLYQFLQESGLFKVEMPQKYLRK
ncbi:DUF5694 domain-containing protein [Viridibacillus arvi]|uniref:DUF5694 domain-containing protein n=1 Tax=Viridibacillus arvi TaxID=263475 RepID=UPI0038102893